MIPSYYHKEKMVISSLFSSPARILAGVFFIMLCLLSAGCGEKEIAQVPGGEQNVEIPDQIFDGFEMTITESGIKKGWIQADRAEKYTAKGLFKAENLAVLFYTQTGAIKSVMTSRKGLIHTDSGDMEAMDSVVVISSDSTKTLLTEHLVWKKKNNRILGDSAVEIRSPRGVVFGDGIEADAGFENLEVKNPTGDIHVLGEDF
jgi:LPS export ABC transporter protein LptC